MLIMEEFKKNIKFFISMTLVLTLLMAAGVSLFNFSFEISKRIYESIEEQFEYGYKVEYDGFLEIDDALKVNGASYATYSWTVKKVTGINDSFFNPDVYNFEDYLPKNFSRAMEEDGFLIDGSLWDSSDNIEIEGKNPIFISNRVVESAFILGVELSVGDVLSLCEPIWSYEYDSAMIIGQQATDGISRQFYIKGIYKKVDHNIPEAVISLNAEQQYSQDYTDRPQITTTHLIINSVNDYKKFSAYASKIGFSYEAGIEEDIGLANLFSVIFAMLSIVILLICGIIAFVYCTMFINKRLNFIGLLKALGQTTLDISKQIFILLLIVFGISFLIANLFSIFLTSHFSNLAISLFDYKLNTGFNFLSQGIFAVLATATALISAFLLNRRITKISIAQVLTQKE